MTTDPHGEIARSPLPVESDDSRAWWEERRRHRIANAERLAAAWRAENPERDYPDLDFSPPDCPMCLEETRYEDGSFICDVCDVLWPSNGYGHQAEFIGDPEPTGSTNAARSGGDH
jgi:hypothetical protein